MQRAIEAMPETGTVAPMRAMPLELPGVKSGVEEGIATGVDPVEQPKVDGTEFQGVSQSRGVFRARRAAGCCSGARTRTGRTSSAATRSSSSGRRARHEAKVIGVIDAIGPMAGMEMRAVARHDDARSTATTSRPSWPWRRAAPRSGRALEAKIAALLDRSYPNLEMQSAADAKKEVSDEINRTFNMFNAIVVIAIIVSLLGVINTLAMSVIERTREIGVLRALGASRWQVRSTMLDESLMITVAGTPRRDRAPAR